MRIILQIKKGAEKKPAMMENFEQKVLPLKAKRKRKTYQSKQKLAKFIGVERYAFGF